MKIKKAISKLYVPAFVLIVIGCIGCGEKVKITDNTEQERSYAIYAEFARDSNKLMEGGLNRRIFNVTEAQSGTDITLEADGSITLQPGTYHISGFSIVSMQTTFAPVVLENNNTYLGYSLVYPEEYEKDSTLEYQICIGTPGAANYTSPSLFNTIFTCEKETSICVGHQSGENLNDEVYLSVYEVEGTPSPYHVFARIEILKL